MVAKKILIGAFLTIGFLSWPSALVWGADFSLTTAKNTYEVGETIPVKIILTSPSQASNAVSGVVSFSADKLRATSLSKTNSVINMWVQEPSYYNDDGQVNFEGVILNPGFTGSNGTVLTINFQARAPGQAQVSFANGSILANDGVGTNILKKLGQISLTIVPATAKVITPGPAPKKPIKVTPVATTTPVLDNTPPEQLAIIEISSLDPARARFYFSASDSGLGVDYYQFSVDDLVVGRLPFGSDTFETPDEVVGLHRLTIAVVDKAGNRIEETINFVINKQGLFGLSFLTASNGGLLIIFLIIFLAIILILIVFVILLRNLRRWLAFKHEEKPAPEIYIENPSSSAKIVFRGQAELTETVVLMRNGQIVAETKPGADHLFEFTLDNLPTGLHHFSVVAVEALGNPVLTQNYPVMLSANASIVVSGINIKTPHLSRPPIVENLIKKDINYPEPNV